mmetsp:Transcript_10823/g.16156  ORF Transcript_10823/g.16156 Transcript_10823/m.16156 type:complete len:276 (+) Transcript_10823:1041-1868(+)
MPTERAHVTSPGFSERIPDAKLIGNIDIVPVGKYMDVPLLRASLSRGDPSEIYLLGSAMWTHRRSREWIGPSSSADKISTDRASSISFVDASSMANAGKCVRSILKSSSKSGGGFIAISVAASSRYWSNVVGILRRIKFMLVCLFHPLIPRETSIVRAISGVARRPTFWRNCLAQVMASEAAFSSRCISSGLRFAKHARLSSDCKAICTSSLSLFKSMTILSLLETSSILRFNSSHLDASFASISALLLIFSTIWTCLGSYNGKSANLPPNSLKQ